MDNINNRNSSLGNSLLQILGVLLRLTGIYIIGFSLTFLLFKLVFHIDLSNVGLLLDSGMSTDQKQKLLVLVQTIAPLIQFILLPILYILLYKRELYNVFILKSWKVIAFLLLSLFLYFSFLPILEFLVKWNQSWHLPGAYSGLEQEMIRMEERAKEITLLLVNYDTKWGFVVILFTVAILPAIGEELFFRGLLQNEIKNITGNHHFAIWLSALVFSFVHFQFFGFVPRMLLGALFGYAYVWSGNILVPMVLHFLNNASTLIIMHTFKEQAKALEGKDMPQISLFYLFFSIITTIALIYYIQKLYKERIGRDEIE